MLALLRHRRSHPEGRQGTDDACAAAPSVILQPPTRFSRDNSSHGGSSVLPRRGLQIASVSQRRVVLTIAQISSNSSGGWMRRRAATFSKRLTQLWRPSVATPRTSSSVRNDRRDDQAPVARRYRTARPSACWCLDGSSSSSPMAIACWLAAHLQHSTDPRHSDGGSTLRASPSSSSFRRWPRLAGRQRTARRRED